MVNFEINFDKDISLFLGANGSGKSTVFEVLNKLRRIIVDEEKVDNVFDIKDMSRWLKPSRTEKTEVQFELDIEGIEGFYKYFLVVQFWALTKEIKVQEESFSVDDKLIVKSKNEKTIVLDNTELPFENSRSCMRYLSYDPFLAVLRSFFIVRINPYDMVSTFNKVNVEVKSDFSNYAEWFAHLNEKSRREISIFEKAMRDILPGFDYFRILLAGQAKVLQVEFENTANKKEAITYDFDELSEGQKVLIVLYALVYCAPENSLICIDEPENFLALPEIQPWFDTLYDQCTERGLQAILISHHPKIINLLANDSGYWFSRESNLTRLQKISAENESGLSIAELIERGWIDEH
ncbi:MAG: ATP-binding protein [Methylococcaceae bacterium]|nr:ATP-binding protein [Methylococcaceae bacterium]